MCQHMEAVASVAGHCLFINTILLFSIFLYKISIYNISAIIITIVDINWTSVLIRQEEKTTGKLN